LTAIPDAGRPRDRERCSADATGAAASTMAESTLILPTKSAANGVAGFS